MRARRKRQLNYKKYLKQVKKVEDWVEAGRLLVQRISGLAIEDSA